MSDRALLIIDVVEPFPRDNDEATRILKFIQGELRYFRERDRPVLFSTRREVDGSCPTIVRETMPRPTETVLDRGQMSAFYDTDLEERLRAQNVGRLTLVGVGTASSVLMTAGDAIARGFHVVVPDPCVWDEDRQAHEFALRLIRDTWMESTVEADMTSPNLRRIPTTSP